MIDVLSTAELRRRFLIAQLFAPGELQLVETGLDGMIAGGIMPRATTLRLESGFLHRREAGVINIGEPGVVRADGRRYELDRLECLYLGMGTVDVEFGAAGGAAVFYFLSAPAERPFPTVKATRCGRFRERARRRRACLAAPPASVHSRRRDPE